MSRDSFVTAQSNNEFPIDSTSQINNEITTDPIEYEPEKILLEVVDKKKAYEAKKTTT